MPAFKHAISPALVRLTATLLARQVPGLDPRAFAAPLLQRLDALELKARVALVAEALDEAMPPEPEARRRVILAMLHPDELGQWNGRSSEDGLCGWGVWPLTAMIGKHGLGSMEIALATLRELTKRGTAEFDVRPFIISDPDRALAIIGPWTTDPNHHVRRLVSEGTRPRLPWGMRLHALIEDPTPMLPVLAQLRDDPSDYVRRSVANHLNDIAKDHPDLVAGLAADWMRAADMKRVRLLRHACRSLVKQGHAGALAAFGLQPPARLAVELAVASPRLMFPGVLVFDVTLHSTAKRPQRLVVDYVIQHRKADGSLSAKVFKWTMVTLGPGQQLRLQRNHAFRAITTRRYHSGVHRLGLRINGADFGDTPFELRVS